MKEWMKSLTKKQKLSIAGMIAAIILLIIVVAVAVNNKGKDDPGNTPGTDSSLEGTEGVSKSGEDIQNEGMTETDEDGNPVAYVPETDEDGNVIEPTSETDENGDPVSGGEIYQPTNPTPAETKPGTIRATNASGEFIQDVEESAIVEPGPDALKPEDIKNYETVPDVIEDGNDTVAEESLKIESVGIYSGVFVENGEDITVDNVASMLVTNTTDKMLQVARFTMKVNGSEEDVALFQVTDLPAGASALILELNKRPYTEGETYEIGEEVHTFYDEASTMSDMFSFELKGDMLVLTNLTDQSFDDVYVHYKYVQEGGAYLGGIAYRSHYTAVGPNESVPTIAHHFTDKISQIIMVEVVTGEE